MSHPVKMSCCDFSYLSTSYKPLCFSVWWILNPSYKPLVSAAALLPMLLHWKCYWEHTRRDRYSASVVLIIGFNGKIHKILLILFYILSQTCSSGSCMNWLLPILYKKVLSQCDSSTLEVSVPHLHPGLHQSDSSCPGLGGKHTRMSLYLKAASPHFSSMLSRSRSHPEAEFWQHGLTRDSGDGQQGA